jgi:hypothetical protein
VIPLVSLSLMLMAAMLCAQMRGARECLGESGLFPGWYLEGWVAMKLLCPLAAR